jgi:hypothetical protein
VRQAQAAKETGEIDWKRIVAGRQPQEIAREIVAALPSPAS